MWRYVGWQQTRDFKAVAILQYSLSTVGLSWDMCVYITTDVPASMTGKTLGLWEEYLRKLWMQLFLHRKAQAAKGMVHCYIFNEWVLKIIKFQSLEFYNNHVQLNSLSFSTSTLMLCSMYTQVKLYFTYIMPHYNKSHCMMLKVE